MIENTQYLLLFLFSFVLSVILMIIVLPKVIGISQKKKLFDFPDERKMHSEPIPRLGGISFAPIILLVLVLTNMLVHLLHLSDINFFNILMFAAGLSLIYMLGINDDLGGVHFVEKLFIQFLAALFLMSNNMYIHNLGGLFGVYELPYLVRIFISVLAVILLTNAMNLIDGVDGLAAGITAILLLFFGILFYRAAMWMYVGICVTTIGVLLPFFYYNFCCAKCRIFMGDTGSLTLGYILSFLMIHLLNQPEHAMSASSGYIILLVSGLFIPLFDAFRVIVSRMLSRTNPFLADRNHIHHLILDMGISPRCTVLYLLLVTVVFIFLNWILLTFIDCTFVLLIDLLLTVLLYGFIYFKKKQRA